MLAFIVFLFCVVSVRAQAPDQLTIGSVTSRPGEKVSGFVEVPPATDVGTQIPITIVQGRKPGPVLLLMAGVHGSEYAPIVALQRVRARVQPELLSGTLILVQVANIPSFLKRTIYYGPVDGKNLNRMFPGKADGSITERIAYVLTEQVFRKADYVIDIHCGDANEALIPYVAYYTEHSDPSLVEKSKAMAMAFGIQYVKAISGRSKDFNTAVYSTNASFLLGKPTMAVESGELAKTDEASISTIERGVFNILRHLQMLPGTPAKQGTRLIVTRDETIRSTTTGIFYPLVNRGRRVRQGELIGYVTDFFGKRIQEAKAPFTGIVLYITATPPINAGEPVASVGQLEAKPTRVSRRE